MGADYGSTHIRTEQFDKVREVVERLAVEEEFSCLLSPVIDGWIGIYNDMNGLAPLGASLAKHFREDILSMMVYDDDVFCYWYYRGGQLVDRYNSCPDYFGETQEGDWSGHPERLKPLVSSPQNLEALKQVVHPEPDPQPPLPPNIAQQVNHMKEISSSIEDLMKNPEKMVAFGMQNNVPFPPEITARIRQMAEHGNSLEEIQKAVMERPELFQNYFVSIIQVFMTQQQAQTPPETPLSEASDFSIPSQVYAFAGHQMIEFASLLKIPNVPTAYEYLLEGETDGIVQWNEFIQIPPQ